MKTRSITYDSAFIGMNRKDIRFMYQTFFMASVLPISNWGESKRYWFLWERTAVN